MTSRTDKKAQRRADPLTRERIAEAAVELLDTAGERGLTFPALSERLSTGPGAIYWHVSDKNDLLGAATEAVIGTALPARPAPSPSSQPQREQVHAVALALYDAIEAHPWLPAQLAVQLSRNPWGPVTARIFEGISRQVIALNVPAHSWFTATSALMHYILGAAAQNAANTASARDLGPDVSRASFFESVAQAWQELDPRTYPSARAVAGQLGDHDDREQFLAGIDLILAGFAATYPATTERTPSATERTAPRPPHRPDRPPHRPDSR
ncbi:TetR/AcrR family transcriptional regulator [Streptomyces albus]|uniref:TetR/AcrR family transcriptional regulator n=1 Tax=Streptomyces albus TaxID=1888 RepID=UPI0034560874